MLEASFLEYNQDNILSNLLQAEEHLKVLKSSNPEHGSCVQKHLLIASGEIGEAISHSAVAKPEMAEQFKALKEEVAKIREDIKERIEPIATLLKIRSLRQKAEKIRKGYDTTKCKACSMSEKDLFKLLGVDEKYLKGEELKDNKENKWRSIMADKKDIAIAVGSQFVGRAIQEGTVSVNREIVSGVTLKNLVGIGAGLAATLSVLSAKVPDKMKLPLAIIGSKLLVDEIVDVTKQQLPAAGVAYRVPALSVPMVSAVPREEVAPELVTVD